MMKKQLRSICREWARRVVRTGSGGERGATYLVFAVLVIPVVLGFLGLVTEMGQVVEVRRQLQTVADAAALAGAQDLPNSPDTAVNVAYDYVGRNSVSLPALTINSDSLATVGTGFYSEGVTDAITVTVAAAVPLRLMPLLGYGNAQDVGATATAIIGSLGEAKCVLPLALVDKTGTASDGIQVDYKIGEEYELKIMQKDAPGGNTGALALFGSGANDFYYGMGGESCLSDPVAVGDTVDTKTGSMSWKQTTKALANRIAGHEGHTFSDVVGYNPDTDSYTLKEPDCPRLAYVPIIPSFDVNGSKPVEVLGFAMLYLDHWDKNVQWEIWGRFIDPNVSGPFSRYTGVGPKVVRLVR